MSHFFFQNKTKKKKIYIYLKYWNDQIWNKSRTALCINHIVICDVILPSFFLILEETFHQRKKKKSTFLHF